MIMSASFTTRRFSMLLFRILKAKFVYGANKKKRNSLICSKYARFFRNNVCSMVYRIPSEDIHPTNCSTTLIESAGPPYFAFNIRGTYSVSFDMESDFQYGVYLILFNPGTGAQGVTFPAPIFCFVYFPTPHLKVDKSRNTCM